MKDFLAKLEVCGHALLAATLSALVLGLDQLGGIDLKPYLAKVGIPPELTGFIIMSLPIYVAFLKPLLSKAASNEADKAK
jgi:hypothetical protein